jgi:hypothetical protein
LLKSLSRTRIPDPIEQCLAHIATPRHKDHGGELYTVFRIERVFCEQLQLEIDKLEVKSGYSIDTVRRQFEYRENCTGVEFIWCYKYTCDNVKLLGNFFLSSTYVFLTKNCRAIGALDATRARRRHCALSMPGVRSQAPGILPRRSGRGD